MTAEELRQKAAVLLRQVRETLGAEAVQDIYAETMVAGDVLPPVRVAPEQDATDAWEGLPRRIKSAILSRQYVTGLAAALEHGVKPEFVMSWSLELVRGSIPEAQAVMRRAMLLATGKAAQRHA